MRRFSTLVVVLLVACGPVSAPPDGGGADGGGLDAGALDGGPATDAGVADCQAPYRRCQAEFRFRALDEQTVELRGNFRADGWQRGEPMRREGDSWVARVEVGWGSDVQYKFLINNSIWVTDPANPLTSPDGNSLRRHVSCDAWSCPPGAPQQGAFDWRDAVLEFVFVDRFFNADPSNDCTASGAEGAGQYQGGDWKGVTQKIREGYFSSRGVNALWLTVPSDNTLQAGLGLDGHLYSAYHGYWPVDPTATESCFGTKAELLELVSVAHQHGLQVLFDFAMVHVHVSSPLYAQHPEWFWPLQHNGGQCVCGQACSWDGDGQRCWFTDYLPHWNYTVPAAREYSVNAAVRLLEDTGADGLRLDAIKHVETSWLTDLRARVEALAAARSPRPRMYFVGETFTGSRELIRRYVEPATKLDGQFDFPLRIELLEAVVSRRSTMTAFSQFVLGNDAFYGPNALMSTWIGNHDLGRVIHMAEDVPLWGGPWDDGKAQAWANQPQLPQYRRPFERVANAFAFLLTSPGVPLLYYGDDIGLPGAGDPDNRRFMQWENLSADQLWLRERVTALAALRKAHPALRYGTRTSLEVSDDAWAYAMSDGAETVYVAINRGDAAVTLHNLPTGALRDEYGQETLTGPTVTLAPRSARVLVRP